MKLVANFELVWNQFRKTSDFLSRLLITISDRGVTHKIAFLIVWVQSIVWFRSELPCLFWSNLFWIYNFLPNEDSCRDFNAGNRSCQREFWFWYIWFRWKLWVQRRFMRVSLSEIIIFSKRWPKNQTGRVEHSESWKLSPCWKMYQSSLQEYQHGNCWRQ